MTARKLIEEARGQHESDAEDEDHFDLDGFLEDAWTREPMLCTLLEKALAVVEAARLRRYVVLVGPGKWSDETGSMTGLDGSWVAVPHDDFEAVRSALHAFAAAERQLGD